VLKFDFGPEHATADKRVRDILLRPGYVEVTEGAVYSKARGHGWKDTAGLRNRYEGSNPPRYQNNMFDLTRDGIWGSKKGTFVMDLPNGRYKVWWLAGFFDRGAPTYHYFDIHAEGVLKDSVELPFMRLPQERMFEADVADGQLTLEFSAEDWWVISALVVYPIGETQGDAEVARARREIYLGPDEYMAHWKQVKPRIAEKYGPAWGRRRRGYTVFHRTCMEDVYPSSRPRKHEIEAPLSVFLTPGEFEPLTVSVCAHKRLAGATVAVDDLKGPAGARLLKNNVDVRLVWCNAHPVGPNHKEVIEAARPRKKRYMLVPRMLLKRRPDQLINVDNDEGIVIEKGETQRFWLTIKAPEALAAGTYTGEVRLAFSNAAGTVIPLTVRVLPFRLRTPPDFTLAGWLSSASQMAGFKYSFRKRRLEKIERDFPGMVRKMWEHAAAMDRKAMQYLADHNCNGLVLRTERRYIPWEEHRFVTPLLEKQLDLYKEVGFARPPVVVGIAIPGFKPRIEKDMEVLKQAVEKARNELRKFKRLQKDRNWPNIYYYSFDEPNSAVRIRASIPFLDMLNEESVPAFVAATYSTMKKLPQLRGVKCYSLHPVVKLHREMETATGNSYWFYHNNCIYQPWRRQSRFLHGYYIWRFGFKGFTNCHYGGNCLNPYNELPVRDVGAVMTSEGPVPVVQWEAAREGVDDLRYIHTLECFVREGLKSTEKRIRTEAEAAKNTLADFKHRIDPDRRNYGFRDPYTFQATYEGPVWKPSYYDENRRVIANLALRLYELMSRGKLPEQDLGTGDFMVPAEEEKEEEREIERRMATCVHTKAPPTIDGRLDDAAWQTADVVSGFLKLDVATREVSQAKSEDQTEVRTTYDDRNLYIGVHCRQRDLSLTKKHLQEKTMKIWADDRVEVFIDANHDEKTYVQFVANPAGQKWVKASRFDPDIRYKTDLDVPQPEGEWETCASVDEDSWSIEIAVPFSFLGAKPVRDTAWGFALGRYVLGTDENSTSCGFFHKPWEYGELLFEH